MIKFEDKIESIDKLIQKNRGKWHLSDISGHSFEDIAQIIRIHIFNKWDLWDQERPFECWCNKIIIHQIKNCVRNIYSKDAPPCRGCPFDRDGDLCGYTSTGTKCAECPAFKKWSKKKQAKYLIKTATSIDSESFKDSSDHSDPGVAVKVEGDIPKFHQFILQFLNPKMQGFYILIYIRNYNDNQVIDFLKKNTGKGITKRQLLLIKKNLQTVARNNIAKFDPEEYEQS